MATAPTSLKLVAADRERLRVGAAALGVALDEDALRRFEAYADLLDRWRSATNLISCATAAELVDRHLLDALACAWPCDASDSLADIGSGAGLPGIPLAIVVPRRRTLLIEPRRRRAVFLRDARRVLGLAAIEVIEARAEEFATRGLAPVEVAVGRAVWSSDASLDVVAPWIRPGGLFLSMRSGRHRAATSTAPSALALEQTLDYRVGAGRPRRIDVFRRAPLDCST